VPNDEDKPAPETQQPAALMAPTGNEYKRQIAVRFFAVAGPPVATRLQWVEEDAAGLLQLLESGRKLGADILEWVKRQWFVCHRIFVEPVPPSLDRLINHWVHPLGGRPSSEHLVRPEAQRRLDAGEVPATLRYKVFCNQLSTWLATTHPDAPSMGAGRIEKCVPDLWHADGRGRQPKRTK
jgi:hypothetical protein